MAKSKKRKVNNSNKNTNNSRNKKNKKQEVNAKPQSSFIAFMSKKWPRITLHIITAIVWIFFLADFFTFKQLDKVPNVMLSVLALVTLIIEYAVSKERNNK